ncbi:MAG: DUF1624 domain-containing protein [Bacteroidetes bacterium]|nr:DUF1624 domain-containing protein [Bacteroidota bacterium]
MPPSKRLAFIDLLRGWAVIVMIETHVVNATIASEATEGFLFQVLMFLNGLVAPSFLFASGMAYAVTTRRKLTSYLSLGAPLFRQLWRLLFILLLAYALHLPKFNLGQMLGEIPERQWLVFFQSDVLHCIAVSLLFLQVVLLVVRTERRLYQVAGITALIMLFVTPLMWGVDWLEAIPAPFAAYMNGLHFSLFPLFPWSVFLLAGAIAGYLFSALRDRTASDAGREKSAVGPDRPATGQHKIAEDRGGGFPVKRFAWAGSALIVFSFALMPLGWLYPTYDYWRYSPSFVLLRLGIVVLLCSGLMLYEERRGVSARSWITLVGRESLLVYTTHLLLIYGNFGTFNFRRWSNHTFGLEEAFGWTFILLGLMFALAFFWDWVRRQDPRWTKGIQWAVLAVAAAVFIWGPGS